MSAPLSMSEATRTVARRELTERLRDKSFWFSTVLTLVILGVVLFLPKLLGGDDTYRLAYAGPAADQLAASVKTQATALDLTVERARYADEAAARAAITDGKLDAYVAAGKVVVKDKLDPQIAAAIQTAHRDVVAAERLRQGGMDPAAVRAAQQVAPLAVDALDPTDPKAEMRGQIAFIGSIVLYGQLIGYCMWVAFGIVEEKASRVVELILSAISTRALLAGKILGIGLLGFAQLAVIAAFGLSLGNATGMLNVTTDLLIPVGFVLLWFVLGYAFYSSVFAASAARVSRQEELQNVIGPANMLIMVSFFATFYVNAHPDALVSRVLAILPPFSALCAPVRMARGDAPLWEIGLALVLMLAAIAALVVTGARIYEGAILRMGAKISLLDAWRGARTRSTSAVEATS
ncbi:ABC transporter permease [Actinopolymorpha singaporensis]|uniref:ABC-2 type transport system permease protein n=1 Tax=Actinopolymorpha singaporensis TaxID=117157 RepID=A0A1H1V984_9ACTN|nr:ABC transporter permease [Actinopolymorpha singaporensis]SDS81302.1 ABC-2 type transport system permease protein [Actinopolymorpha singaporensis]